MIFLILDDVIDLEIRQLRTKTRHRALKKSSQKWKFWMKVRN